jgi:hypothetical protein
VAPGDSLAAGDSCCARAIEKAIKAANKVNENDFTVIVYLRRDDSISRPMDFWSSRLRDQSGTHVDRFFIEKQHAELAVKYPPRVIFQRITAPCEGQRFPLTRAMGRAVVRQFVGP